MRVVCLFKPAKRLLFFPKAGIDECDFIPSNAFLSDIFL
jgi:hypothetical protein